MKREDIVGVYRQLGDRSRGRHGKVIAVGQQLQLADHVQRRRLCRRGEHAGRAQEGWRRRPAAPIWTARRRRSWPRRRAGDLLRRALRAEGRRGAPPHRDGAQSEPDRADADPRACRSMGRTCAVAAARTRRASCGHARRVHVPRVGDASRRPPSASALPSLQRAEPCSRAAAPGAVDSSVPRPLIASTAGSDGKPCHSTTE